MSNPSLYIYRGASSIANRNNSFSERESTENTAACRNKTFRTHIREYSNRNIALPPLQSLRENHIYQQ